VPSWIIFACCLIPSAIGAGILWWRVKQQLPGVEVNRLQLVGFWLLVAVLIVASPVYAYVSFLNMMEDMVQELGIPVELKSRRVQLTDRFSDLSDYRRIYAQYMVLEPLDEVKEKLFERIDGVPGWRFDTYPGKRRDGTPSVIGASCDPSVGGPGIGLDLFEDGILGITLHKIAPEYCFLR
jgi:hypothetical protein